MPDAGHAYQFVRLSRARSKGPFDASIYRPLPDLVTAIDRLLLEEVPTLPLAEELNPERAAAECADQVVVSPEAS